MKAYIVETSIIRENLKNLKKRAGNTSIWAVLKGNGYGLGLEPMAALCAEAGIDRFCVTMCAACVKPATRMRAF